MIGWTGAAGVWRKSQNLSSIVLKMFIYCKNNTETIGRRRHWSVGHLNRPHMFITRILRVVRLYFLGFFWGGGGRIHPLRTVSVGWSSMELSVSDAPRRLSVTANDANSDTDKPMHLTPVAEEHSYAAYWGVSSYFQNGAVGGSGFLGDRKWSCFLTGGWHGTNKLECGQFSSQCFNTTKLKPLLRLELL